MAWPPLPSTDFGPTDQLDHSNRQGQFIGWVIGFTVLACVAVLARMYTRAVLVRNVGPDDWTIFAGMLCLIASATVCVLFMKAGGIGYHVWDIPQDAVPFRKSQQMLLANQMLYPPVLSLSKASILLFYRRITPNRVFHIFIWVTMGCTVGLAVAGLAADLLQCTPIAYFWDRFIPGGNCFDQAAFYFAAAGSSVLGDVWILVMPMPVFWGLQISLKRRLVLMSLFAVGFLVVIVSAYRLYTVYRVMFHSKDITYDDSPVWSAVELCVSVICCTIPALRPLFSRLLPTVFGNTEHSGRKPLGPGAGHIGRSSRDGSSFGARRPAGGTIGRGSRGGGGSYGLESLATKRVSSVFGTRTVGPNDSEEMMVSKPIADLERSVPPHLHDCVFYGTNSAAAAGTKQWVN